MKAHIKILAIFLLNFILSQSTIAQNSSEEFTSVRSYLDAMFENLDKTKISTGFLEDYAIDLVDLHQYNGSDDPNGICVTRPIFDDIVRSISSASVVLHPIKANCNYILDEFGALISDQTVNLKYALFGYNFIAEDALTSNKIEYDETQNKVYNVYRDGAFVNPYEEAVLFAFSPSAIACTNTAVKYKLNIPQALRNLPVHAAWFDADDGNGYRQINPTAATININYPSVGEKILKLKVSTTVNGAGRIFTSRALIKICDSIEVNQLNSNTANRIIDEQISKNGVTATVTGFSATGGSVRKPIIVVEGFDPWQLKELATLLNNTTNSNDEGLADYYGFTNYQTFYDTAQTYFLSNGYDYIYVDWHDSLADITKNGELLIDIINHINSIKASYGSTESNIVIGQSMGGLITRYALKTMENNEDDHQVSTFVSHDVPHLGANVPIGAQYFIYQLLSFAHGYTDMCNTDILKSSGNLGTGEIAILNTLQSDAAKQMMYYYVKPDGTVTSDYHKNFYTMLKELGFPNGDKGKSIENIAITNGQQYNLKDYLVDEKHFFKFEANAHSRVLTDISKWLIKYKFNKKIPSEIINFEWSKLNDGGGFLGSSKININAEFNPITNNYTDTQPIALLDAKYIKTFCWINQWKREYNLFESYHYTPAISLLYDEYPGSIYEFVNIEDINKSSDYHSLDMAKHFTFIPMASSLCIQGNELSAYDYRKNYYFEELLPNIETPFDAFYIFESICRHIDFYCLTDKEREDEEVFSWLLEQLSMTIDGPEFITSNGQYNISGYDGHYVWSTSDPYIATIDGNGTLTASGHGVVTIIAQNYENGKLYRKTKNVSVGMPDMIISKRYHSNRGYMFTASTRDSAQQTSLNNLIANGTLKYEWSIIDANGNMSTTLTNQNYIDYLPSFDEYITVTVRLVETNSNNKGQTISLYTNILAPFDVNYKLVTIDKTGMPSFILVTNQYEVGLPSRDFITFFREIVLDCDDNIFTLVTKYLKGTQCYIKFHNGVEYEELEGVKEYMKYRWEFSFFNSDFFINKLSSMINLAGSNERRVKTIDIKICNSDKQVLQHIPFAIIYNPDFNTPER